MIISATIIFTLSLGHRASRPRSTTKLGQRAYPTKNPTPLSNLSELMPAEEQRLGWAS